MTKSITRYPISNTIIAKCHCIFHFTFFCNMDVFISLFPKPHTHKSTHKNTNTHTPKCTNSDESFPNISIPLFTVCLRLNHWLLFWPLNVEEGKEKTSSVRFYNISLHEKWILVRTPGNLIGLLLLLLQLYFLLTSRLFRSSL